MAGLEHGHAAGFLARYRDSQDIELVGVAEPDSAVAARYIRRSRLDPSSVYPTIEAMLERAKPQAVVAFTSAFGHLSVVTACASRKIPVMMEKPLAVSVEQACAIEHAATESGISVLVDYETTWYPSNHAAYALAKHEKALGEIRKVVVHDGHRGPKEIGVQPEFLAWLTDLEKNGAGSEASGSAVSVSRGKVCWRATNRRSHFSHTHTAKLLAKGTSAANRWLVRCFAPSYLGVETMKEAPVSRVTCNSVAAFPRYIDFRRQPCSSCTIAPSSRPRGS
jgi:hypothetical protein